MYVVNRKGERIYASHDRAEEWQMLHGIIIDFMAGVWSWPRVSPRRLAYTSCSLPPYGASGHWLDCGALIDSKVFGSWF